MGFCTGFCQQLHGSEATPKALALPKHAETTGPAGMQGICRVFVFKMQLALAVVVFEDSDSRPPSSAGSVIRGINDSYPCPLQRSL